MTRNIGRDWSLIEGGSDQIKPERGDCYPEQWIGRPIGSTSFV